jgi:hypothetical protein
MIARICATTLMLGMPSCMVGLVGIYLLTSNLVFFFFVNVISLPNVEHTQVGFEGLIDCLWLSS